MAGQVKRLGPAAMSNAAADILTTPAAGYYFVITKVSIVNKTAGAVNASLFIGATAGSAAGTEFLCSATPIAAYSETAWYGRSPMKNTEYLSGLASALTSLTITIDYEHCVIP